MAQVTLRINGYAYMLGCKDGEEQHLQAMAEAVEGRIEGIKTAGGQSGEARMLAMAALMMADDLYEMELKLKTLEARLEKATAGSGAAPAADPKLGRKLGKLAVRAEEIAARLEPN